MKIAAKNTEISDSGRPLNAQGWEALGENEHFVVCEVRRGRQSWRVWRASQFVYAYLGKLHGIKYQFNHWFSLHSLALRPDILIACKRGSFFGNLDSIFRIRKQSDFWQHEGWNEFLVISEGVLKKRFGTISFEKSTHIFACAPPIQYVWNFPTALEKIIPINDIANPSHQRWREIDDQSDSFQS